MNVLTGVLTLSLSGENEQPQTLSTDCPSDQFQCCCCSHKHLVYYSEGKSRFRWKTLFLGGLKTQEDLQECFTTHRADDSASGIFIQRALGQTPWFCKCISIQVSICFEKAVGTVRTASKVGKTLDFIESNNSAAAGRFIPPDYTPKRNDLYCISSVERIVVEVKDAIETNMELSKDKQVQVMDGGDKLH